jgi:hypothetical protein
VIVVQDTGVLSAGVQVSFGAIRWMWVGGDQSPPERLNRSAWEKIKTDAMDTACCSRNYWVIVLSILCRKPVLVRLLVKECLSLWGPKRPRS